MTKQDALTFIRDCGEDEGPETYAEAAEIFEAVIGRKPDADDGDQMDLWSHACAAASGRYVILARAAGQQDWQPEGSGDVYDSRAEAEADMVRLERANDDGEVMEYMVDERA